MSSDPGRVLAPAPYAFLARPRLSESEPVLTARNCRTLLQDYLLARHGRFLPRDAVEHPGLWHDTGTFVALPDGAAVTDLLRVLPDEAILFAERLLDSGGKPVPRARAAFDDIEDYRLHLHTAVYLAALDDNHFSADIPRVDVGPGEPAILHATAASGCTCLCSVAAYARHYRTVAAKSLPSAP